MCDTHKSFMMHADGELVRKRAMDMRVDLTAQEVRIARIAAEGLTKPEIAAPLYVSPEPWSGTFA